MIDLVITRVRLIDHKTYGSTTVNMNDVNDYLKGFLATKHLPLRVPNKESLESFRNNLLRNSKEVFIECTELYFLPENISLNRNQYKHYDRSNRRL